MPDPGTGEEADTAKTRLSEYALTSGELGAAAAQTVMVALLPVLLRDVAPSAFWLGFAVGGEGIFVLAVPFVIGSLSDRLPSALTQRFGRRSFFLLSAAPLMAATVAAVPFVDGYWPTVGLAFLFFLGLQVYNTPLLALMVDAVPNERRARVQGMRGAFRALGLAFGLVGGGLLYSVWEPLPFLLAGLIVLLGTTGTILAARRLHPGAERDGPRNIGGFRALLAELRENGPARRLLVANALWNGAIDGIRPYFFVFAAVVVGINTAVTSAGLIFLVAGVGIGSIVIGRMGDRHNRVRLLQLFSSLLMVAMVGGFFMRNMLVAVPILLAAGIGSAALIALPYPLYTSLTDEQRAGEHTGVFVVTLGMGRLLAPMLVGAAIDAGRRVMPDTEGYPVMWLVAAVLTALGTWLLRKVPEDAGVAASRG